MKVLVCGGRDFTDYVTVNRVLSAYFNNFCNGNMEIIHGGARGADTLAGLFAKMFGLKCHIFPAEWDSYGKGAGPIRNQKMLDEGKPTIVIAFPGGADTADMIKRAKKAGILTINVREFMNENLSLPKRNPSRPEKP